MSRPQTPSLTVDIIITPEPQLVRPVVLIERRHPPHGWALPGGFVDIGETVEQAAVREAREETSLDVRLVHLLGVYSDPARDPRGHTASVVYVATTTMPDRLAAADDAARAAWYRLDNLPSLAFDHAQILQDYRRWLTQT